MAVIAGPIQTAYQTPDYSPVIEANRLAGMQQQQIMQGAVGQVTDYFKQQGEKKKLIKQSDVQIDAALKLFPDLAPTLQGVRDQIRDENVPLNDRAAVAESVAGLVNMGVSTMHNQSNQILKQQKLRQNAEYQSQQLQIAQQNANSRAASAMAAGQQPPKTLNVPVEGGTQTMQWDANLGSYIPIQVSGMGGGSQVSADGSLVDIVKQFEGFNPRAYSDYGQTSIGYGTKGKPGEVLTEQQASQRLESELAGHAKRIEEAAALKGVTLNENQFKALTSFDYNTGKGTNLIGRFGDKPEQLAAKMLEYTKADGETLRGLEKRRQVEAALFLSPVEEQAVQPQPTVGFKPSETKTFRPATPEEAKPYGGGFGQIDTSTGQFYPITQSSNEKGSFRPANEQESAAYGGIPGQIDTKTGRFYAIPQPSGTSVETTPGGGFKFTQGAGVKQQGIQQAQEQLAQQNVRIMSSATDEAFSLLDSVGTNNPIAAAGSSVLARVLPATETGELQRVFERINGENSFERMQTLRASSPTGGAAGSMTEKEWPRFEARFFPLDVNAKRDTLEKALRLNMLNAFEAANGTPNDVIKSLKEKKITQQQFDDYVRNYVSARNVARVNASGVPGQANDWTRLNKNLLNLSTDYEAADTQSGLDPDLKAKADDILKRLERK